MNMPITGQLGIAGFGAFQTGGPPQRMPQTLNAAIPKTAVAYIGHVYANDGQTFKGMLGPILNSPQIQATLNAGQGAITLDLPNPLSGANTTFAASIYGNFPYGSLAYGGSGSATLGSVVRLTEQGGTGSVIYTGLVEQLPDDMTAVGLTTHQISLTPLVAELGRSHLTQNYVAVDTAQMVRDAVNQTTHLNYTPDSIPNTGLLGTYNFSQATCADVLNQARLMSGANYYWYCDQNGTVWFLPQKSLSTYTLKRGQHYSQRHTTGGDITNLYNVADVTGGIPTGGTLPLTSQYRDPASIAQYGMRVLQPPMVISTCTDQPTLDAIAKSLGGIYNRVLQNVTVIVPALGFAVAPGDAVRLWEPSKNPMPESEVGTGGYMGPYVVLSVKRDGASQEVVIGDIPVSGSSSDYNYMAERIATMTALSPLTYAPASLNVMGTLSSGGIQTAPAPAPGAAPVQRMSITGNGLVAYDGTLNNYGLPAGQGASVEIDSSGKFWIGGQNANITIDDANGVPRVQIGSLSANGISPAQEGMRINDASGAPILDSFGLIGTGAFLANDQAATGMTITGVSTSYTTLSGSGTTFTVPRSGNVFVMAIAQGNVLSSGTPQNADLRILITNSTGAQVAVIGCGLWPFNNQASSTIAGSLPLSLPGGGTYTVQQQVRGSGTGANLFVSFASCQVLQLSR